MLKMKYDNVDDIPSEYAGLYTDNDDGTHSLTGIEGLKTESDMNALREIVKKERNMRIDVKKQLDAIGRTPDEIEEMQSRIDELEALKGDAPDADKVQKLVDAEKRRMQTQYDKLHQEKADLESKYQSAEKSLASKELSDIVRKESEKLKLLPAVYDDVLLWAERGLKRQDDGTFTTDDYQTPAEFISKLVETKAHWLPPSQGGGSGGGTGGGGAIPTGADNPYSREGWNLTKQAQMIRDKGEKIAGQYASKAGSTIGSLTRPTA